MANWQGKWTYALFQAKESNHFFMYLLPLSFLIPTTPGQGSLGSRIAGPSFSTSAPPKVYAQQAPHPALRSRAGPDRMLLWSWDHFTLSQEKLQYPFPRNLEETGISILVGISRPCRFYENDARLSLTTEPCASFWSCAAGSVRRLEVVNGADLLDDVRSGSDLGHDLIHALIGHG